VDKRGERLLGGFSSSFSTAQFAITSTSPTDGTVNWNVYSSEIIATFSDTLDTATVARAFSISPAIAGQLEYPPNFKTVYFIAAGDLAPSTTYKVTIDTSVRSTKGERIAAPYTFSFLTGPGEPQPGPFGVGYTEPYGGDTTVSPDGSVQIYFDSAIDTASFRQGFSITPAVAGLIGFPTPNAAVFSPLKGFPYATTFTVTLATSVRSFNGTPLAAPYTFTFATLPFEVTQTSPADGSTEIATGTQIQVFTSDAVDPTTLQAAVSFNPPVQLNNSFNTYSYGGYDFFYFYASNALQTYTVYTVTISTALKSQSGAPLAQAYKFTFATGGE
jgi:hypothetical protein